MKIGYALFVLLLLAVPLTSTAQWSTDPHTNNAICTATDNQFSPATVSDGAGGAIIAWQDERTGTADIYAQRISATGVVQWTTDGVAICTATGGQQNPKIVSDGAGGAIIIWQSSLCPSCDFPEWDIYAQRINDSGVVQWAAGGVPICTAINNQIQAVLVSDGAGGAIVAWSDFRGGGVANIYTQRISGSGAIQWVDNGALVCDAALHQVYPVMVSDGRGGAIIAWQDGRNVFDDIYAQRVSASGTMQWHDNGVVVCGAALNQYLPAIASDGAGGAIVTWEDKRDAMKDIWARRIDSSGTGRWHDDGVPICRVTGNQTNPAIISDGAGGAIITWEDPRPVFDPSEIYAQRVNDSGQVQWHEDGAAICTAGGAQDSPTLVPDGTGGAIITWRDRRGEHSDVYAQRIDAGGAVRWNSNGAPICTASDGQILPAIVTAGGGRVIIAAEDHRNGAPDIFAQLVDRNGLLGHQDPAYQVSYRTATYTEWSHAVDTKSKQKAEKRKPYASRATFHFANNTHAVQTTLHIEFSQKITTIDPIPLVPPAGTTNILNYTDITVDTVTPFGVTAYGNKGKSLMVKKWWWGATKPRPLPANPTAEASQLLLKMPNLNNVGEEMYGMTGLSSQFPTGLLVGKPQGLTSASSVIHPKYMDVMKSLTKKVSGTNIYHSNAGKGLCYFDGVKVKPIGKQQKSLPPNKQNNILFGDLLALKLNLAASDLGAFQSGLGSLIYGDGVSGFDGLSLYEIVTHADSMISSCMSPPSVDQLTHLQSVLANINAAFSGAFDTSSFGTRTVLAPVRMLQEIWYLVPPIPGATSRPQPVIPSLAAVQPMQYALEQNYPNPFNPTTTIRFTLVDQSRVTLTIYNSLGQQVATLFDNELLDDGDQEVEFDASRLASGVYFCRLMAMPEAVAGEDEKGNAITIQRQPFVSVRKMMLVK